VKHDLTHSSWFSGVGGLDLGLERAGWRTVSFSEIDPYASAVLARHWPGVPNLGDITRLSEGRADEQGDGRGRVLDARPEARHEDGWRHRSGDTGRRHLPRLDGTDGDGSRHGDSRPDIAGGRTGEWRGEWTSAVRTGADDLESEQRADGHGDSADDHGEQDGRLQSHGGDDWQRATLWSGGFPCQDLSVAGKRAGMGDGTRSGLAFAFLDLVERYRPPAFLLENVAGLLSSHGGRDMATLLGAICDKRYGVAYRTFDARFFGVPQRRRRVFILGLRSDPDDADGRVAAERAAEILAVGTRCERHPPTGGGKGKGAADEPRTGLDIAGGLTRRYGKGVNTTLDDGAVVLGTSPDPGGMRAPHGLARRLDHRAGVEVVQPLDAKRGGPDDNEAQAGHPIIGGGGMTDDPLLPPGLDSHRYRCCGNGVVTPVAEWLGRRLAEGLS
jgi:DNA (cytosine-5)-methyltransferase 1